MADKKAMAGRRPPSLKLWRAEGEKMKWSYFVIEPFTVSVNYELSVEEMIAEGNYDQVTTDIAKKLHPFKKMVSGEVNLNLITYGPNHPFTKDILKMYEKYNLRTANVPETLAFGKQYPNEQKKEYLLTALSPTWQLILWRNIINEPKREILRTLRTHHFVKIWPTETKFLAACK